MDHSAVHECVREAMLNMTRDRRNEKQTDATTAKCQHSDTRKVKQTHQQGHTEMVQ